MCGQEKELDQFYYRNDNSYEAKCHPCRHEYGRQWRRENNDKVRNRDYMRRYGITLDEYQERLEAQDHKCCICNTETKLVVDHCHNSLEVRGLLCQQCNTLLGMARDDENILLSAIKYLAK